MRLINIRTRELKEFFSETIQQRSIKYAILSHTWGDDEISYAEWAFILENPDSEKAERLKQKQGFKKIEGFLQHVRELSDHMGEELDLEYAWVDTVGINKESSAELTEAINSMYVWYRRSHICYAYLSDVRGGDKIKNESSDFQQSRWFTRGWTLQELIAPLDVEFLDQDWNYIAAKTNDSAFLEELTGIPFKRISMNGLGFYSCAQKMSWVASRQTTRVEDIAYCLLGIFDVNMPLIYGEGIKAFQRLQEEIIKKYADHTIFAWSRPPGGVYVPNFEWPIFAPSPQCFLNCSRVRKAMEFSNSSSITRWFNSNDVRGLAFNRPFQVTNFGISMLLPVVPCSILRTPHPQGLMCRGALCRLAVLRCSDLNKGSEFRIAIWIRPADEENQYKRTSIGNIEYIHPDDIAPPASGESIMQEIYLATTLSSFLDVF
jgi:hypothetical protein